MTVSQAVRQMCLGCLGANTAGTAHDCLSSLCPLYVCSPFRGRLVPKSQRGTVWVDTGRKRKGKAVGTMVDMYDEASATAVIAAHQKKFPRKRPSMTLLNKMCYACQPETREDCAKVECPLFFWRPWQPGGRPKRRISAKQGAQLRENIAKLHGGTGEDGQLVLSEKGEDE